MIPTQDAIGKFAQVIARVDPRLVLDRGNVRYVDTPYPGVEYGLRLGEAGALLFMPEADMSGNDWESRMFKRIEAARHYLEGFPLARSAGPSSSGRGPSRYPRK